MPDVTAPAQSNIPVPDPSVVTDRLLARLEHSMRDEMGRRMDALHTEMTTRLAGMDKASEVLADNVARVPTILDRETARISELYSEKFNAVQLQFKERDVRTDQDKLAATTAVNAALQAQKEAAGAAQVTNAAAIDKSERGFTKEIDGLKTLIESNRNATDDKITDLTARLNRTESAAANTREVKQDGAMSSNTMIAIGGLIAAILTAAIIYSTSVNTKAGNVNYIPGPAVVPLVPVPK